MIEANLEEAMTDDFEKYEATKYKDTDDMVV